MKDWRRSVIDAAMPILEALRLLSDSGTQICLVTDASERLQGTVTDGDIRRGILRGQPLEGPVESVMNRAPKTAPPEFDRESLIALMTDHVIHQVPIVDAAGGVLGVALLDELVRQPDHRPNWVVLMAGGQGRRLRPLTETTPKPLLHVGGKAILEHIIDRFVAERFRKFYVSVNYKADMVRDRLGDGTRWGAEFRYIDEDQPLGTAGPLGLIDEKPDIPIVVMNGDLMTNVNFGNLLAYHAESGADATMAVREYEFEVPFGVVRVQDDRMASIDEKPVHSFLVNAGLYVLDPSVLSLVKRNEPLDMPDLFRRMINSDRHAAVFPIQESWLDIGRHDDFNRARTEAEA